MGHKGYGGLKAWDDSTWQGLFLMVLALCSALYLVGHNWYGLFDVDEAIFTQATLEMRDSNNYVAPTYNDEPRYHKPPLIYWLQSASLWAFGGFSPLAARLPSALMAILTLVSLYTGIVNLTHQYRVALLATAIFGLSLSWLVIARAAVADAALNFFMLAATLQVLYLVYIARGGFWGQVWLGILLGLGLLAKGPVALLTPGIVGGVACLLRPQFLGNLLALNPLVILGAMALTIAPWLVLIIQESGLDFLHEFIFVHNLGRFFDGLGNTQSSSGWYYVLVLLVGFFPWVILLLGAVPWVVGDLWDRLRSENPKEALPALGFVWLVGVVALFSFSQTKLAHYIVPALPGAAILLAFWLEELPRKQQSTRWLWLGTPLIVCVAGVFLLLNRLLLTARPEMFDPLIAQLQDWFGFAWPPADPLLRDILMQDIPLTAAPLVLGALWLVMPLVGLVLLKPGFRQGVWVMIIGQAMVFSLLIAGVVPTIYRYTQQPLADLAAFMQLHATPEHTIYHYRLHHPSARLLSGLPFVEVHKPLQFIDDLAFQPAQILIEQHRVPELSTALTAEAIPVMLDPVCAGGYCVVLTQPTELAQPIQE